MAQSKPSSYFPNGALDSYRTVRISFGTKQQKNKYERDLIGPHIDPQKEPRNFSTLPLEYEIFFLLLDPEFEALA